MKIYGLRQSYIKSIRNAFKRGELSFEEAMYNLSVRYSNNIVFNYRMENLSKCYAQVMRNVKL